MRDIRFATKEWESEIASGFPISGSIPSSLVKAAVLLVEEQGVQSEFLARRAAGLIPQPEMESFAEKLLWILASVQVGLRESQSSRWLSAKDVRRAVFLCLEEAFATAFESDSGGLWRLSWRPSGKPVVLECDFGGKWRGFRWWLRFPDSSPSGELLSIVSYERLMGIPDPHWDLITAENVDASGKLLLHLIKKTVDAV
jgi:hypothetical protein